LDDKELNDFAQQVCALTLTLPHAATGRQNDAGANLQPAGILIIPLATDPAVPGAIYTADLVELKRKKPDGSADGRQGWHRAGFIQDGEEGGNTNVTTQTSSITKGNAAALLALLAGNALPGVVGKLVGATDPLALLTKLFGGKR
jgi:hypothetical protein